MKINQNRSFLFLFLSLFFLAVMSSTFTACKARKAKGDQVQEQISHQGNKQGFKPPTKASVKTVAVKTAPAKKTPIQTKPVLYVKERVNLRTSPNNKSKVLAKTPTGTVFAEVKKGEQWTKVHYKNHVGYVYNALLFEANLSMADDMILVNKGLPLPKDFDPGYNQESLNQMNQLLKEAKQNGFALHIVSSYRSFDVQKKAYRKNVKNLGKDRAEYISARPGYSEHQTGLSYDLAIKGSYKLTTKFGDSKEGQWIAQNAPRFGFILRYPKGKEDITGYFYEPWHFRYVGEKAKEITESGLTLDEYFDAINPDYKD